MKTFLLQGDSITDAGRNRENDAARGNGYPTLIAAELMYEHPGEVCVINRGISGNRVVDLYARMKKDIVQLKPDYLSILIGVNDVWHDYADIPNGVSDEKYRKVYDLMIEEILQELPEVKIYILEPFVLPGTATQARWEEFSSEVKKRAVSARAVAEKYHLPFIPLQEKFDALCNLAAPDWWLRDGVHPSAAGHEMIARELLKAVKKDL